MAKPNEFFTFSEGKHVSVLKQNAEQVKKILDSQTVTQIKHLKDIEKEITEHEAKIEKIKAGYSGKQKKKELEAARSHLYQLRQQQLKEEEQLQKSRRDLTEKATSSAIIYEQNAYSRMSAAKRREYDKAISDELKDNLKTLQVKYDQETNYLKKLQKDREKAEKEGKSTKDIDSKISETEKNQKSILSEQEDVALKQAQAEASSKKFGLLELLGSKSAREDKRLHSLQDAQARVDEASVAKTDATLKVEEIQKNASEEEAARLLKIKAIQEDIQKAQAAGDKKALESLKAELDQETENFEQGKEYLEALNEEEAANHELEMAQKEELKAALKSAFDPAELGLSALSKVAENLSGHLKDMYGSQSRMIGRLQGSDVDWKKSILDVTTTVGVSGVVSQKNIVAKMVELVDSGVAYNLEMRAFLAETSENIASTFDAANGTLLRMIRLQQADTTAARLGMEASLTKLFNEYFSDTSYLTDSGPADNITTAILDASATMSKDDSLQFEFNVQKWLGSLYSLGMSSEAVEKVAKGLNYLGTGDYAALSNDASLQTIFALSASRSGGKSYDQLLKTGLNGEETNKLLRSMIEYLAEIANSQTDYVTRSAYANLFGMSVTDLTAFASLTSKEIENIYNRRTSYKDLFDETQTQLKDIVSRLSVAQLVDTVIENAEVGAASLIGSNAMTYGMWKSLAVLKDYVGEIKVPGITAMGNGIASGLDLLNLAQTAMAGMGLIGSLVSGIGSMLNGGATKLDNWDFKPETSRGGGLRLLDLGSMSTTSYSETLSVGVGGGNGDVVSDVSLESGKQQGMDAAGITSEEFEESKDIPQKTYDALAGEETPTVISLLSQIDNTLTNVTTPNILDLLQSIESISGSIEDRLDPGRVFYTAIAGIMSSTAVSEITNLSTQLSAKGVAASFEEEENSPELPSAPAAVLKDSLTGISMLSDESQGLSLETIISNAVEQAIRNISYSLGTGIPVNITNLPIV